MRVYFGRPHCYSRHSKTWWGYALAQEMKDDYIIDKYRGYQSLILDNGANELGSGIGGEKLIYLCGRLMPYRLILPDVLHDDELTKELSLTLKLKMDKFRGLQRRDFEYIAVNQANDFDSFCNTLLFWKDKDIKVMGIPYDTTASTEWPIEGVFTRIEVLNKAVKQLKWTEKDMKFHLLGTKDVVEIYYLMRLPKYRELRLMIESHDTTTPWALGRKITVGEDISFGEKGKNTVGLDFDSPLQHNDWIEYNIAAYLAACKVSRLFWINYCNNYGFEQKYWYEFEHFYD